MTKVRCCTYNQIKEFSNMEQARAFFLDCMRNSEGAEQERYVRVYSQLMEGHTYCTDNEKVTEEDLIRIEKSFAEEDKNACLEQRIFNRLFAIKDNETGIIYHVDYPNYPNETDDGRANVVCVHFEDTYMVDNVVTEQNTERIYIEDIISNPKKYTLYELKPFKVEDL